MLWRELHEECKKISVPSLLIKKKGNVFGLRNSTNGGKYFSKKRSLVKYSSEKSFHVVKRCCVGCSIIGNRHRIFFSFCSCFGISKCMRGIRVRLKSIRRVNAVHLFFKRS